MGIQFVCENGLNYPNTSRAKPKTPGQNYTARLKAFHLNPLNAYQNATACPTPLLQLSPEVKAYHIDTSRCDPSTTRDNVASNAGTTADGITNAMTITHENSTMPPQKSLMENTINISRDQTIQAPSIDATESVSFTVENLNQLHSAKK